MSEYYDKKGKEINEGDIILIKNSRGCYNQKAKVEIRNNELGYILLTGKQKGKKGLLKTWINAIWTANNIPENFLEVYEKNKSQGDENE